MKNLKSFRPKYISHTLLNNLLMTALKTKVKIIFFFSSLTLIGNVHQQNNNNKKNCACKMCAKLYYMCSLK